MKRGILVALGLLVLAVAAAAAFYWMHRPVASHDWLRDQYGLNQEQADRVTKIEADYQSRCMAMCARISDADATLGRLIQSSASVTPEIRAAIANADAVRTDCRASMLAHFYEVAAALPADKRDKYLKMVLPSVLHPEGMAVQGSIP